MPTSLSDKLIKLLIELEALKETNKNTESLKNFARKRRLLVDNEERKWADIESL